MSESYLIDTVRCLVVSRAWGTMTDEDWVDHYRRLRGDPAFDAGFRQLADMREVTRVAVSAATVAEVARRRVFAADARRAFVVGGDAAFGVARMYATYAGLHAGGEVRVYRDMRDAERWLSGTEDAAAPWVTPR